jgi:hypothetical protein
MVSSSMRFTPTTIRKRTEDDFAYPVGLQALRIILYFLLAVPSLIGAAVVWDHIAVDKMFHCTDSCGPIDFIPPFVHSVEGDHYIAPALLVWMLWLILLAVALALPMLPGAAATWIYRYAKDKRNGS